MNTAAIHILNVYVAVQISIRNVFNMQNISMYHYCNKAVKNTKKYWRIILVFGLIRKLHLSGVLITSSIDISLATCPLSNLLTQLNWFFIQSHQGQTLKLAFIIRSVTLYQQLYRQILRQGIASIKTCQQQMRCIVQLLFFSVS